MSATHTDEVMVLALQEEEAEDDGEGEEEADKEDDAFVNEGDDGVLKKPSAKLKSKAKAKAKAKVKPKGKAKSKAKAKAKAKAKQKPKPKPKPKQGTESEDEDEAEDEEHHDDDDEDSETDLFEDEGKTDRCKKNKFMRMIEVKTMPDNVVVEWNKTLKLNTGKRTAQRELINRAFDRSNGQLVLNMKRACYKTTKETYETYEFTFA